MIDEQIVIRAAETGDAADVSELIVQAIRVSNAADYSSEVIGRVSLSFTPAAVVQMIARRHVLVATKASRVVGTASLDKAEVRSVFVLPDSQGCGIGARLMAEILRAAHVAGLNSVQVQSTVTAVGFYAKLGFVTVRDHWHDDDERTVVMERRL